MLQVRERARPSLVFAVMVAVIILAAWRGDSSAQGPVQGRREVRVGVAGVPTALDPVTALDGAPALLARQVFDTLVTYREGTTDIEPALATRWAVSRDGRVWSFTLRENVRFHDGTVLTATDVVASFQRHLDPQLAAVATVWPALLRGRPGVVKEVRAASPRTVEFVLVQPYAPILTVLAHPGFGIARSLSNPDGRAAVLVGTGPFRVVDVAGGRFAVEAFAGYWGTPPRSERLLFLEVPGDDHAEAEMDARSLDVWFPAGAPRRNEGALSIPGLRMGYLALQTEKEPFTRKALRHAVAAALDPAVIAQAVDRAAIPLQSFLPPGTWGRRDGEPVLGGTRELVKKLLVEGGWPKGFKPTMVVASEAFSVDAHRLGESMQQMLGAADIPASLRVETSGSARALLQSGEYDMALTETGVAGGDPHLMLFPLSTSETATRGPRALNFSFYRNPRLDEVLARASQLSYRVERQKLYRRAQALLANELPWIPVYVRLVWAVARPEVRGLRLHPTGFHRLDPLSLDALGAPR
jgi:peptide/nickel transport system substrate-binding protein